MKRVVYEGSAMERDDFFCLGKVEWIIFRDATNSDHYARLNSGFKSFATLPISRHTYLGLGKHNIIDLLEHLFPTEWYDEPADLPPADAIKASKILRWASKNLPDPTGEFHGGERYFPEPVQFWIKFDMPLFRKMLVELAEFMEDGARQNYFILWDFGPCGTP